MFYLCLFCWALIYSDLIKEKKSPKEATLGDSNRKANGLLVVYIHDAPMKGVSTNTTKVRIILEWQYKVIGIAFAPRPPYRSCKPSTPLVCVERSCWQK